MDREEIKDLLIKCINEIQELNGLPLKKIKDTTRPVGDLEGFDSIIMVELAVRLSGMIKRHIEDEIFYPEPDSSTGKTRSLHIRDIVEQTHQIVST